MNPRHIVLDSLGNPQSFYFNPANFGQDPCWNPPVTQTCPLGFYGTYRRNSLVGPGRVNLDLSLEKATPLSERVKLAFRVEAFNLFNHTQFKNPGSSRVHVTTARTNHNYLRSADSAVGFEAYVLRWPQL